MRAVTTTTNVYQFSELSDKAKEKARDWYRGCMDSNDYADLDELPLCIAGKLGFDDGVQLQWSVGYTQSDHATIVGKWRASLVEAGKACAELPQDEGLRGVAEAFESIAARWSGAWAVTDARYGINDCAASSDYSELDESEHAQMMALIADAVKAFNAWAYDQLRASVDWLHSDEYIDDCIIGNEYEFTEAGKRCELPESEPVAAPAPVRVAVFMEGGLIQSVLSDTGGASIMIVDDDDDIDQESIDSNDYSEDLASIPFADSDELRLARVYRFAPEVSADYVAELFRIKDARDSGQPATQSDI